jgi:tRNA 2-thiouridine synthesizing protein D
LAWTIQKVGTTGGLGAVREKGVKLDCLDCGLCVDEPGAAESVEGVRRDAPGVFWSMADSSNDALVIPIS